MTGIRSVYKDIILDEKYSYKKFINEIDNILLKNCKINNKTSINKNIIIRYLVFSILNLTKLLRPFKLFIPSLVFVQFKQLVLNFFNDNTLSR